MSLRVVVFYMLLRLLESPSLDPACHGASMEGKKGRGDLKRAKENGFARVGEILRFAQNDRIEML